MRSSLREADLDVLLVVTPCIVVPVHAGHSATEAPAAAVTPTAPSSLRSAENEHEGNNFKNLVDQQDPEAGESCPVVS